MTIPLDGSTIPLLFLAAVAAIVVLWLLELSFQVAFDQWTRPKPAPPERPRFPWTDRTGT